MRDDLNDPNKSGQNEPIFKIYLILSLEQEEPELSSFIFEAQNKRCVYLSEDKRDRWGTTMFKVFERSKASNCFKNITIHVNRTTGENVAILKSSFIVIRQMSTNQIKIPRDKQIKSSQDEDMKIISDHFICGGKVLNLVASKKIASDMDRDQHEALDIEPYEDLDVWDNEDMGEEIDN